MNGMLTAGILNLFLYMHIFIGTHLPASATRGHYVWTKLSTQAFEKGEEKRLEHTVCACANFKTNFQESLENRIFW